MFKKAVSVLLILTIAFSCISITAHADITLVPLDTDVFDAIARLDPDANPGFIKAINAISKVGSIASGILSAYNGTMSVLKMLGVVPDPEAEFKKTVIAKLNNINNTTKQINENIESLKEEVDRQFTSLHLQFDKARVDTLKQNINSFNTNYEEKMAGTVTDFTHTIDAKFNLWYQTGKGKLENGNIDRGFDTQMHFVMPDDKADISNLTEEQIQKCLRTDKVTIDGTLLDNAIKNTGFTYKADTYSKDFENVLENYFNTALSVLGTMAGNGSEEIYYNTGFVDWYGDFLIENSKYLDRLPIKINKDSSPKEKQFFIFVYNKFSNVSVMTERVEMKKKLTRCFIHSAVNSLTDNFVKEIATEGYGTTGQYINRLCNQFENYCKQIINVSGDMSPLANQLEILSKTYNFQGEIVDSVYDLRDFYVCNLTRYAELYFMMMGIAQVSDYNRYVNLYSEAVNTLCRMVNNFIVKDENGNAIKNYSYQLGCPIEFKSATLSQKMTLTHQQWESNFGWFSYDAYDGYSKEPWSFTAPDNKIASSTDMMKLLAIYKGSSKSGLSFNDYLEKNMFGTTGNYSNLSDIVTSKVKTWDFNLDSNIRMKVNNSGFRSEHFDDLSYFDVNCGKTTTGNSTDDENFRVHDSAVAEMFNLKTGVNRTNVTLQSRALYGYNTKSVQKDRMAFFYTGSNMKNGYTSWDKGDDHTGYTRWLTTSDNYYYVSKENNAKNLLCNACFSVKNVSSASNDLKLKYDVPSYMHDVEDGVEYGIYYDEEKHLTGDAEHDKKVLDGFIDYANRQDVIDNMRADYYNRLEYLQKTVDEDGIVEIPMDKADLIKLADALLKYYIPDLSKAREDEDAYIIDGKEGDFYVPKPNAKGLRLVYGIMYIPLYKLDFNDGKYSYELIDIFDIIPALVWGNGEHYITAEDCAIKSLGLDYTVNLPLVEETNCNAAHIEHFYNCDSLSQPYEVIEGRVVKTDNNTKHLEMVTNSFSPFRIKDLFNKEECSHIDNNKDGKCDKCGITISQPEKKTNENQKHHTSQNTLPNTGDDGSLKIYIMLFVISSLAICPCLIVYKKKRREM